MKCRQLNYKLLNLMETLDARYFGGGNDEKKSKRFQNQTAHANLNI